MIKTKTAFIGYDNDYNRRLNGELEKIQRSGGAIKDVRQILSEPPEEGYLSMILTLIIYEDAE